MPEMTMPEMNMDPWDAVGPDRQAFASYLAQLEPADWETESWSAGWTVKDVAAHLLVPTMSRGGVFFSFLKSGFKLDKMNAKYISQLTGSMTTDQIVSKTRETAGVRTAPPGLSRSVSSTNSPCTRWTSRGRSRSRSNCPPITT